MNTFLALTATLFVAFHASNGLPTNVAETLSLNLEKLKNPHPTELIEELSGQFEGDMVLSEDQMDGLMNRNGLIADKYRWRNNTVHYFIVKEFFTNAQIDHIRKGLNEIEKVTCLKFVPLLNVTGVTVDYVNVTGYVSGCFSSVGRQGGVQQLNLQPYDVESGCFRIGTIVHEFNHALGFYHMQSSTERDEFVNIVWTNIQDGKEHNFNVYNSNTITNFGEKYDYGSVMHYSQTAFSKNGERTIVPVDPEAEIGQRLGMSKSDIERIRLMYKCASTPVASEST